MTTTSVSDVYYDPYDVGIDADPYPTFRRLREEAPLYYNEPHDFYALSRYEDVERGAVDRDTFISGRGGSRADQGRHRDAARRRDLRGPADPHHPPQPPVAGVHPEEGRGARAQDPRAVRQSLDPLVGTGGFDFVADLGAQMPMRVIGMLLGVPEEDQQAIRDRVDRNLRTEAGQPMDVTDGFVSGEQFAEYIDWRAEHPSDDIMTDLLHAEFEDETGTVRASAATSSSPTSPSCRAPATRPPPGSSAGPARCWPSTRTSAALAEDPSLIPNAIEELLRFEPPAPYVGRYVAKDVEIHGQTVPAGNAMLLLLGAANRDDRRWPDADRFDIHRNVGAHLTFGYGPHFCLGAALARLEGRVALDEVLKRFPEWDVDWDRAKLAPTSTVRGWEPSVLVP